MRRCFIHIGTHKTGTTSLQVLLNKHYAHLTSRCYLYPRAGRPHDAPNGHHNIAWELSKDWRFDKSDGTIDDLIREIQSVTHNVILSSEDFECSLYHTKQFSSFVERLQSCSIAITLIVYLRNQVDYCKSLYLTMLGHGLTQTFEEFLGEVLTTGRASWRDWVFPFCYGELVERMRATGAEIVIRSYDSPRSGSLLRDCLEVFGLDASEFGSEINTHLNKSVKTLDALKRFYQNRTGRSVGSADDHILRSLCALSDVRIDMSERSKALITSRFRDSNRYVTKHYGVQSLDYVTRPEAPREMGTPVLPMEAIFSAALPDQLEQVMTSFAVAKSTSALHDR